MIHKNHNESASIKKMIEIKELVKRFGDIITLDKISLKVEKGEILGLFGASGSGKTTLIKILVGLLYPSAGTIFVDGSNIVENALATKAIMGYVPQKVCFYPQLTAWQFLSFIGDLKSINPDEKDDRIRELLNWLGLGERKDITLENYTDELIRKVIIASALLGNPKVLIFDSAAEDLDEKSIIQVQNLLKQLRDIGRTILFASSDVDFLKTFCNRIAVLDNGRIAILDTIVESKEIDMDNTD